ncbi:MAG: hypothetical protein WD645_00240 [Dehalococcoidia bacterium]
MSSKINEQDRIRLLRSTLEQDASRAVGNADLLPRLHHAIAARRMHGRQKRHGRVLKWGLASAMGVLAVAAIALVAIAEPWDSGGIALAGWTAEPQEVDPAIEEMVMGSSCSRSHRDDSQLPLRVIDQRGNVAVAYFASANASSYCFLVQDPAKGGAWVRTGGGGGWASGPEPFHPPVDVNGMGYSAGSTENLLGTPLGNIRGRVSPEVATVVVTPLRGPSVTAAVQGDYFMAWWPEDSFLARYPIYDYSEMEDLVIRAYGEDGSLIATLDGVWFLGYEPWDGAQ